MKLKKLNRRQFIKDSALALTASTMAYRVGKEAYQKYNIKRICTELPDFIHMAYSENLENPRLNKRGRGIVIGNKFYTVAHITSQFHVKKVSLDYKLQEITEDYSNDIEDIAIFNIPDIKGIKQFPCKPGKPKIGEEVFLVGDAMLAGIKPRSGRVTGKSSGLISRNVFGMPALIKDLYLMDIPTIPGDSGCPIINKDYELIGLASQSFREQVGYFKDINDFIKHDENIKKANETGKQNASRHLSNDFG